jgi:hypothetical protein
MFNAKWGFICGGVAFLLAFIISLLLGHTNLLVALIRAACFAALFFGLGAGLWAVINIFIPELLSAQGDAVGNVFSGKSTGSRVNITLDDTPEAAVPGAMPGIGGAMNDEEVGDFNDLISRSINPGRDIDQDDAIGYTAPEEAGEGFTPSFDNLGSGLGSGLDDSLGDSSDSDVKIDGLGDFSMDFGAFVPEGGAGASSDPFMDSFSFLPGSGDSAGTEKTPSAEPQRKVASGKPAAELQGDFDPKEIAAGIRTVMEKDKKG